MYASSQAVRVKVKKCEANAVPEWRKFSIDPEITSLEVLYSLLAKAFEIKSDFSIKYKAFDPAGNEIYLAVLSDWDLDAAFLRINNLAIQTQATEPCLTLQIDIKPFTEVKDWEADSSTTRGRSGSVDGSVSRVSGGARELISPLQQSLGVSQKYVQHMQTKLPGLIMNQMEKTFSMVQKAFNLSEETMASLPPRAPLSDHEFRLFLDTLGQIQRGDELRKVIFFGGIDPSLRRVVWKHILNVYPSGMNGHQRMEYMRRKSTHYFKLREAWKAAIKQGCVDGELSYVTSMVKKDVLRTDRLHPFYAGSDDNQNIAALFNILTTYALNHPTVSYCQGMSDLASPLLVCMQDEAQAYICFCAIMARVRGNFLLDGVAMTQKFAHLTEALSYYDPEFWEYLKAQQADDLLFCYRWLLLELKREFPFEDALRMLEVQWSSLKYEANGDKELCLYEREFVPIMESSAPTTSSSLSGSFGAPPISPSYLATKQRESAYTKVCALRRQSSSASLNSLSMSSSASGAASKLDSTRRLNQSLDDNISQQAVRRHRNSSSKAHQSLDESKMLMLLENAHDETGMSASELIEADDDDVFTNSNSNNAARGKSHEFDFHETNPFKEDAQMQDTKHTQPLKASAKVFLNSTEDDAVEASDDSGGDRPTVGDTTKAQHGPPTGKGIAKMNNKHILSNYSSVGSMIAKQMATAANSAASGKGHFRELKEKIAASSRKGLSFDDGPAVGGEKSQQKLVKNFNEFLNFASVNKNRIADKFATSTVAPTAAVPSTTVPSSMATHASQAQSPHTAVSAVAAPPTLVQVARSGFGSSLDESDSSSVPETTWSCSTAATAIQQLTNVSSHSLALELSSLSSAAHTPDPTPTLEGLRIAVTAPDDSVSLTPEDGQDQEYYPMSTAITRELRMEAEYLDRQVFGELVASKKKSPSAPLDIGYEQLDKDSLDLVDDLKENEIIACPDVSELLVRRRARDRKAKSCLAPSSESHVGDGMKPLQHGFDTFADTLDHLRPNPFIDEALLLEGATVPMANIPNSSSLPEVLVPISTDLPATHAGNATLPVEMATNAADETAFTRSPQRRHTASAICNGGGNVSAATIDMGTTASSNMDAAPALPIPSEFGGGNPFLMFLCLTVLLQHRNTIMKSAMDYNEIAMHFDKMVRKHDVTRVLNQARNMYIDYIKAQNAHKQQQQQQQFQREAQGDASRNSKLSNSAPITPDCVDGIATVKS